PEPGARPMANPTLRQLPCPAAYNQRTSSLVRVRVCHVKASPARHRSRACAAHAGVPPDSQLDLRPAVLGSRCAVTVCSWMNIHCCEYLFINCTGEDMSVKYKSKEERLFPDPHCTLELESGALVHRGLVCIRLY